MATLDQLLAAARAAPTTVVGPATSLRVVNDHERAVPAASELGLGGFEALEEHTLARVMNSEAGGLPLTYQFCIGEIVQREARARGHSITQLVTVDGAKNAAVGFYGEQRTRYCASKARPNARNLAVARAARQSFDFGLSRGARRWVSLKVMDRGSQNGKKLQGDAVWLVEKWARDGFEWIGDVYHPNTGEWLIDPYLQCMLAPVGKGNVDTRPVRLAIERGRDGQGASNLAPGEAGRFEDDLARKELSLWGAAATILGAPLLGRLRL